MRKSIEDYVQKCDPCQKQKEKKEFVAPLGNPETPKEPFQVVSIDLTGPYPVTARGNKYLLTFICHFTKFVEAFPLPDISAETCARIYSSQIVTRHGTGSTLITDQGRSFVSSFFKETCKILGIRQINTSALHPISNGQVERFHRSLHTGLSHYIDSLNTNWDLLTPFYLMAYRATPNTTTGHSPYYLLHGREMPLPGVENLKPKLPNKGENLNQHCRLKNLKASLRLAYKPTRDHISRTKNYIIKKLN